MRTPVLTVLTSIPFLALFGLEGDALVRAWWAATVIVLTLSVRHRL
jgi:hypothetical protein